MAGQYQKTTCAHNAMGQVIIPGVPATCRKCGATIGISPLAGNVASEKAIDAAYPGDGNATDVANALNQ